MEKVKKFTFPVNSGSPINLLTRKTLLAFLESPLVLVNPHNSDSAAAQTGDIFDSERVIDYTPIRSVEMSVSTNNPHYPDLLWVEKSDECRVEKYRMWFDASTGVERIIEGQKVKEYEIHFESTPYSLRK